MLKKSTHKLNILCHYNIKTIMWRNMSYFMFPKGQITNKEIKKSVCFDFVMLEVNKITVTGV